MSAESRLHMTNRNLSIECSKSPCGGGGCVAMNKHHVRAALLEHIAEAGENTCSHISEILPLLHYV